MDHDDSDLHAFAYHTNELYPEPATSIKENVSISFTIQTFGWYSVYRSSVTSKAYLKKQNYRNSRRLAFSQGLSRQNGFK